MEKALRDKVIRVYPARVSLVCAQSRLSDSKRLACALARSHKENILSSKLIENKKFYLSLLVKTTSAQRMLCDICENSDRVYIGYDYDAVFSEHGKVIIAQNAIDALCQKRSDC
ncbi:MAG: adaptor protein MecA [Oscillospiraceae bacterium]|nr:adaptor protein MecA [Oscillospiraceae bacterium]